jgi:uncharacterized protein YjbJ (UPF0337 family)
MNKDEVKGQMKDVAGRIERQVGEWTGDPKKQAHGAAKQVEGKVQNAWGKIKDAAEKTADNEKDQDEGTARSVHKSDDDVKVEATGQRRKAG